MFFPPHFHFIGVVSQRGSDGDLYITSHVAEAYNLHRIHRQTFGGIVLGWGKRSHEKGDQESVPAGTIHQ
ncbi:MAG: hypothetical protein OZ929_04980, partial [Bryobacterales bacterium]|nr:hypothetical protein [Bryobacterales bacterium]